MEMLESSFYANGLFRPPSGLKPALKLDSDMYVSFDVTMVT